MPLHTLALDVKYADGSPAPANVDLTCYDASPPGWQYAELTPTATSTACPPSWWRTTRPVTTTADLRVEPDAGPTRNFLVPGNASTYTAVVDAGVHVQGTRLRRAGSRRAGGCLRLRRTTRSASTFDNWTETDAAGHYDLYVDPGSYTLEYRVGLVVGVQQLLPEHDAHRPHRGPAARPRARHRHADGPRPHAGWPARAVERVRWTALARRRVRRSSTGRAPTAVSVTGADLTLPGTATRRWELPPQPGSRRGALLQRERLAPGRRRRDHRGGQPRDHHHRSGDGAGDQRPSPTPRSPCSPPPPATPPPPPWRPTAPSRSRRSRRARAPSCRRERRDRGELRLPASGDALRGRQPGART